MAYFVSSPADGAKLVDEVDNLRGLDPALLFIGIFFRLVPIVCFILLWNIFDPGDIPPGCVILVFRHVDPENAVHPDDEIDVDRGSDQGVVCHPDRAIEQATDLRQSIRYRSRVHPRSF